MKPIKKWIEKNQEKTFLCLLYIYNLLDIIWAYT